MTQTLSCAAFLAEFCAKYGGTAFAVVGGGSGALYSALDETHKLVHVRNETAAVAAAIEHSLAKRCMTVACVTTGEAVSLGMSAMPTALAEGARVLLLYGCTNPGSWDRWGIQPTEPGTMPSDFYRAGSLLDFGALIALPEQLPRALSRIAVGMQDPSGFVAALGLTRSVQGAPAPAMSRPSIEAVPPGPAPAALERVASAMRSSVAVLAGFGARHAFEEVRELVRRTGARGLTTPRGKGILPGPCIGLGGIEDPYEGGPRPERLLVLGSRLAESSTLWDRRLLPARELIHVDLDPGCFGAAFPDVPTYGVISEVQLFLRALLARLPSEVSA